MILNGPVLKLATTENKLYQGHFIYQSITPLDKQTLHRRKGEREINVLHGPHSPPARPKINSVIYTLQARLESYNLLWCKGQWEPKHCTL